MLGEDPQHFMFKFPGLLRNTPVLEKAAAGHGLLTINPESDGIIRRVPMVLQAQGLTMPSLSYEMLRVITGTDTIFIKSDQTGIKSVGVKGFQIPPTEMARFGFISRTPIRCFMFRRLMCSTVACRPRRSRVNWC